ncbi:TRAP transporter small permease subunit [Spiribacter halobius]|uniref:TRAP transporter small permease protein n=1 Tax=Sediminicurvatus halobius TaxID=2182432 RepID=A0A2U2N773_9GAMM|nr:TRAP transporter small permease subunit [Spiribacter halobius]PWG64943.1 transporter [Spiribacter halobius]UEX79942.1 TRAP transporter small permease subunit [Spiribacter halobius]
MTDPQRPQYQDELIGDFGTPITGDPALPVPLRRVVAAIDRGSELIGYAVSVCILFLTAVIIFEVISRGVFGAPTMWAYDLSYMLYGTIFMLGAAVTLRFGGHIRTDIFFAKFPPRTQAAIDIAFYLLLFIPGMWLFLVVGYDKALHAFVTGERSGLSPWRPLLWPYRAVIPLTSLLLIVQAVSEILKRVSVFYGSGQHGHE